MSNKPINGSNKNNNINYTNNNSFNRTGGGNKNHQKLWSIKREFYHGRKFEIEKTIEANDKDKAEALFFSCFYDKIKSFAPDNLSLFLTKYIWILLKEVIVDPYSKTTTSENQLAKVKELYEILKKDKKIKNSNVHKIAQLEGYEKILDKNYKTIERLICGLGESNVLETSIALHHILGIPYIPGSTFKGVCREVVLWNLCEKKNIDQEKLKKFQEKFYGKLCADDEDILKYQLLFGAQDFKGLLLFTDVFPEFKDSKYKNEDILDLDIMNPHYTKYYSDEKGETVPGDWENPTPIFFLTVRQNTTFHFDVFFDRWRWEEVKKKGIEINRENEKIKIKFFDKKNNKPDKKSNEIIIDSDQVELLVDNIKFDKDIIEKALKSFGVGAKTMLGYGTFE